MKEKWEYELSCASQCSRCSKALGQSDERILSAYDHQSICMECKRNEEKRPDYEHVFRQTIGQCMADTEMMWGDPGAYCYHHVYPYTCAQVKS